MIFDPFCVFLCVKVHIACDCNNYESLTTAKNAIVKTAFELYSSHVFEKCINLFSTGDRLEKIYVLFSWVEHLKPLLSNKLHYSFFTHSQFFINKKIVSC